MLWCCGGKVSWELTREGANERGEERREEWRRIETLMIGENIPLQWRQT